MAEELKLDRHYHDKKLRLVLRDLFMLTADEYARALIRLANVADESVMREPEFTRAQLPSQGGEAVAMPATVEYVGKAQGHGHVTPRADGVKARCGGPTLCRVCQKEQAALYTHPVDQLAEVVVVSRELLVELSNQPFLGAKHRKRIDALLAKPCAPTK